MINRKKICGNIEEELKYERKMYPELANSTVENAYEFTMKKKKSKVYK